MDLKDILKDLAIESLTEEQQTTITTKLEDIISFQVNEQVAEKLEAEKENLVEEFENKYEEYKQDITAKFSNFVDEVLEEEMAIPENIVEYARYGELYKDLIDQIKIRVGIDEGILSEEARNLLKDARDEIIRLQDELNSEIEAKLESQADAQNLALETYRQMKCESVPSVQRKKVLVLLEGARTKEEIDRKFSFIMEHKLFEGAVDDVDPEGSGQHTLNENDVVIEKTEKNDNPDNPENVSENESPFDLWLNVLRNK
jgi:hypothetical protein